MQLSFVAFAIFLSSALASPTLQNRAASCTFPSPPKTSSLSAAKTIAAGASFDGGNVRFDRGSGACQGQKEGGDKDAVFIVEEGGSISNVVIGANQAEGIHCLGSCTLTNVWFEDVCEHTGTRSTIQGGGAKNADDKVVQHNGGGNVVIKDYCVQDFGKLYRSCGNCSTQKKRTVSISNVIATNGKLLAGVNSNYGDVATITTYEIGACHAFS
ncbi:hypothetical protein NLI96_g10337 [Meripilus lineatus]|uniref:Pectate lyase n=1 Tax=Meripilus lineatus TaxID=2056292 RepID=A0AAD5YC33_9APHY|nr:hypothetical protein NLI96_g10337 [Physisporinus lineatus]